MIWAKRIRRYRIAIFGLLAFLCLSLGLYAPPAYSTSVTLAPTIDTWVYTLYTGSSFGSEPYLNVGRLSPNYYYYRSFLKFDFGSIPDASVITSAELTLYCNTVRGSQGYEAHHVASDASIQNTMNWSTQPTTGLTYLDAEPISTTGWKIWDLLDSGSWDYAGDLTDNFFSVRLARSNESAFLSQFAQFYSLENTVGNSYDPFLEIEYEPIPIPASLFLLGSGLIGIVGVRKKIKK